MELDLRGASEDGGLDVGELLVDGRGAGVDLALGDERQAELAAGEMVGRKRGGEARPALAIEEGLELLGRAGKEGNELAMSAMGEVEPLAGSAAV